MGYINGPNETIVNWIILFDEVITKICVSWSPVYERFFLTDEIFSLMKFYIYCLSSFEFDGRDNKASAEELPKSIRINDLACTISWTIM